MVVVRTLDAGSDKPVAFATIILTIFAVGFTLFFLTLLLNFVSIRLVRKYREAYE